MTDYDIWEIIETVRSMPVLDQKEVMSGLFEQWNNLPALNAHAHNLIKPKDAKRSKKRNLQFIANEIRPRLESKGYITWKWANDEFNLGQANTFTRIMALIPSAVRSKKLHKEGGRNWYHLEDVDPSKWIASHEEGPIDIIAEPEKAVEAIVDLLERKLPNEKRKNVHRLIHTEKSVFRIPDKFNSQYRDWADRYITPVMAEQGFNPNANRRVYTKA